MLPCGRSVTRMSEPKQRDRDGWDCFEAIRTGGEMPTTGAEARRNLEIIRAAYRSAKDGKVIEV